MNRRIILAFLFLFSICLVSCSSSTETDQQPAFPELNGHWVVDNNHYLKDKTITDTDQMFDQLKSDGIAEVAIVIQEGVRNNGPYDDEKIWARDWGRKIELGDESDRAIVWLIRPDVKPEENRVTIEISTHLTWLVFGDYESMLQEAADYANADDFDGSVASITRNTDEVLRRIWKERKDLNEKNNPDTATTGKFDVAFGWVCG